VVPVLLSIRAVLGQPEYPIINGALLTSAPIKRAMHRTVPQTGNFLSCNPGQRRANLRRSTPAPPMQRIPKYSTPFYQILSQGCQSNLFSCPPILIPSTKQVATGLRTISPILALGKGHRRIFHDSAGIGRTSLDLLQRHFWTGLIAPHASRRAALAKAYSNVDWKIPPNAKKIAFVRRHRKARDGVWR